jgi:inorganic pyrophosphatase
MKSPYQLHPWHGIAIHPQSPEMVNAFIEIVPTDHVKYEIDKHSGFLKVDRPQKFSNIVPALYGFIPQSYCGQQTAAFCMQQTGKKGIAGDGDPLDILVLTEKPINHGAIIIQAIPIGGLRMIDKNEADDKIIAVMKDDALYGNWKDISEAPQKMIDRLLHYFLTYKDLPGQTEKTVEITHVYSAQEAHQVIRASMADYKAMG